MDAGVAAWLEEEDDPGSRLLLSTVPTAITVQYEVTSGAPFSCSRDFGLLRSLHTTAVVAAHHGESSHTQHAQLWRRACATVHGAFPYASHPAERAYADPCAALAARPTTAGGSGKSLQVAQQTPVRFLPVQEGRLSSGQPAALRAMHTIQQGVHICRVSGQAQAAERQ